MAESRDVKDAMIQLGGLYGENGVQIINDASTHYGYYAGFQTLTSSVQLDIYTGLTDTASTISAFVFDKHATIPCYTTSVALSTGCVIMYYYST